MIAMPGRARVGGPGRCPADTPAAMRLEGVPTTLVSGRSYTASLAATGVGQAVGNGWKLGVFDRLGRGYFADLPALDFQQAFSVGLTGTPYTVSATYAEPGLHADALGEGGGGATRARLGDVPARRRGAADDRARLPAAGTCGP